MNTPIFKKQTSKCLDNLYVAYDGDKAVGMVHRPKNTRTDKNFWRCYVGIGEGARFLGHAVNRKQAENHVAWAYCMMNVTVAESTLPKLSPATEYFLEGLTAGKKLIDYLDNMNKRKIRLNKSKHYKFGIVLPAGEYEAVHILSDVWQVKQNGISLSVTEKQFDFVDGRTEKLG